MRNLTQKLFIYMNGLRVGRLDKEKQGGLIFSYDPLWLSTSGARPISLSFPLADKAYSGAVVYNFFDNLLPDSADIRLRIQQRFKILSNHPFDILSQIGKDCVGALQFSKEDHEEIKSVISANSLKESDIAALLRGYKKYPLGMAGNVSDFRISIAGAQEKTAFLYHNGNWQLPKGDTPTTHIFKLPIGMIAHSGLDLRDSCENEWICSEIVAAFGLPVAETEVLQFEDIKVLSVTRFDRKWAYDKQWILRLPQEDCCQALGISSALKYQSDGGPGILEIMSLLAGSVTPYHCQSVFFRSQIVFWLLAAIDGHAKNFSVFIEPGGRYRLTPLYDIMSAYPLIQKKQLSEKKIKMAMALKGKINHYLWHSVQRRYFLKSAELAHFDLKNANDILDETLGHLDLVISQVEKKLPKGFPFAIAEAIFDGMRSMRHQLMD